MKRILFFILLILVAKAYTQNGTRPDSARVIVGSLVQLEIDVLQNDTLNPNKHYKLESVFKSQTSQSISLAIINEKVRYSDPQSTASVDSFFYVVRDIPSGVLDTNYVVVQKSDLLPDIIPGDANRDNICNNLDFLYIASGIGAQGAAREGIFKTNSWTIVKAYNWAQSNLGGNFKHFDANGDGQIDSLGDLTTIYRNYDSIYNLPPNPVYSPTGGPEFQIVADDTLRVIQQQQTFSISLSLGSVQQPVGQCLGVAFTLSYDKTVFDPSKIKFTPSKWFANGNQAEMSVIRQRDGEIDIAITKMTNNDLGGGELGKVDIVIIDILDGIIDGRKLDFSISKALLVDKDLNKLPVTLPAAPKAVIAKKSNSKIINNESDANLNYIIRSGKLILETQKTIHNLRIYNMLGKEIYKIDILKPNQVSQIDILNWASGVYLIQTPYDTFKIVKP